MDIETYNEKKFLLPDSPRTMACYHAKVMEDGIMKLTIHDCKGSIQFHNNLNNPEEAEEAICKLANLVDGLGGLIKFIHYEYRKVDINEDDLPY